MNQVALTDVAAALWSRVVKGTRIVGIDGPSGSGKTSLARLLVDQTAATLVEIDDFVSWTDFAGWWPRFNDQVLKPLLLGNDAHYQVRDWQHDPMGSSLNGWKIARWSPLIILEGVTCTRRAIADHLAFRIWVEAPREVRLARGLTRDGDASRDLWIEWMRVEQEFFLTDGTRHRADLCVDGTVPSGTARESEIVILDEI